MPAYKYKTEEAKQRHLAYRREYYRKNRERIRQRDNMTARKHRQANPEKYAAYAKKQKNAGKKSAAAVSFQANPDRDLIELEIAKEVTMRERGQI